MPDSRVDSDGGGGYYRCYRLRISPCSRAPPLSAQRRTCKPPTQQSPAQSFRVSGGPTPVSRSLIYATGCHTRSEIQFKENLKTTRDNCLFVGAIVVSQRAQGIHSYPIESGAVKYGHRCHTINTRVRGWTHLHHPWPLPTPQQKVDVNTFRHKEREKSTHVISDAQYLSLGAQALGRVVLQLRQR